jgi:hypothetical protein
VGDFVRKIDSGQLLDSLVLKTFKELAGTYGLANVCHSVHRIPCGMLTAEAELLGFRYFYII